MDQGKIGPSEATWLFIITISTKAFFTSPAVLASFVGSTGWFTTLISASTAILGFTFIYLLLKQYPGKDLAEIYKTSADCVPGITLSVLTTMSLMLIVTTHIREFVEVLKTYVMPLSPPSFIIGIFILSISILAYLGLESIARFSRLIGYVLFAGFVMVLALAMQNYDIYRLFPIFGYGLDKTIRYGIMRSSAYGEIIIIAIISSSLQGIEHIKKVGYQSLAVSGGVISLTLFAFSLTFPQNIVVESTSPMYELATLIDFGTVFQRFEPVFFFIWNIGTFISAALMFFSLINLYCKTFNISNMRPLVFPFSIILFTSALIQENITSVVFGSVQKIREYSGIVFFIVPAIVLAIAKLRKKGGVKNT